MSKGKLFEPLSEIYLGSESETEELLKEEMEKSLKEAKESFLALDPIKDDALLDSIYDWFLKYFGEVK
jgi:hypothetical protein